MLHKLCKRLSSGAVIVGSGNGARVWAVGLQSDSKIIVAGQTVSGLPSSPRYDILISRYNTDGSLDTSFGSSGRTTLTPGISSQAFAIYVLSDDKILVGGTAVSASVYFASDFSLSKLNANGAVDSGFGTAGTVITAIGPSIDDNDELRALAVQADGKILAAGFGEDLTKKYDFALVRYSSNGAPDSSFSSDGIVTTDLGRPEENVTGTNDYAHALAIDSSGEIFVGGVMSRPASSISYNDFDFAVVRYKSAEPPATPTPIPTIASGTAGTLDSSFSYDGITTTNLLPLETLQGVLDSKVAEQSDGKYVVVSTAPHLGDPSNENISIMRFNVSGDLDQSFGTNGQTITNIADPNSLTSSNEQVAAVAIQPDGKILVAGTSNMGVGQTDIFLMRVDSVGALDPTFSNDGIVTTDFSAGNDGAAALAIQPDNKIVLVGTASGTLYREIVAVRYNSDGSLDTSFGTGGKVIIAAINPPGKSVDQIDLGRAVALQSDGKIVIAGTRSSTTPEDLDSYGRSLDSVVLIRLNSDGSLDASFGDAGRQHQAFSDNDSKAYSLLIQSDGKIVVGGVAADSADGGVYDVLIARFSSDGHLDSTFGDAGKTRYEFGGNYRLSSTVVQQQDGKLLVVGTAITSHSVINGFSDSTQDFGILGLSKDGVLESSYGTSGLVTTDVGRFVIANGSVPYQEVATDAIALSTGKVLVVGYRTPSTLFGRSEVVLARYFGALSEQEETDLCSNISGVQTTVPEGMTRNDDGICVGSGSDDNLDGGDGDDTLRGGNGKDTMRGGAGADTVYGEAGNDKLYGGPGDDKLYGGAGNDKIYGQAGNDTLVGGGGSDTLDGGAGKDTINANDGKKGDTIKCGAGKDTVVANRGDRVAKDCEKIKWR